MLVPLSPVSLTAADGHTCTAHLAQPRGAAKAGLVVLQEIFGVNAHIRAVAEGFAAQGYWAVAPALFDRSEQGVELGYEAPSRERGFALKAAVGNTAPLLDVAAAVAWLRAQGMRRVGVVGYCWGGLLSWLSAAEVDGVDAAVCYYGGGIPAHADRTPRCPVMAHFADRDAHIPLGDVGRWHAQHPGVALHLHAAEHGFNCDARASHSPAAAALALRHSLAFFQQLLLQGL